jgi:hypothetical protein
MRCRPGTRETRYPPHPGRVELGDLTHRMLPRVDLPEVLLEVFSWTGADAAFTSITGGEAPAWRT